jgi:molybdopterin synthase catalytic subunit
MQAPRFLITGEPLAVDRLAAALEQASRHVDEGCGAVSTFVGVVRARHKGQRVRHLEYEAFEPLAMKVFARIDAEVAAEWPRAGLAIHHRIGRLSIGDASVAIAVTSAHRDEAFRVCRYAIERVKQVLPVWKHEFFEGGDAWVEGAIADVDDEAARVRAHEVACA